MVLSMFWLEPLPRSTDAGRLVLAGFTADVPAILTALDKDAVTSTISRTGFRVSYLGRQRLTFARAGEGIHLENYRALNGFRGLEKALQLSLSNG